MGETQHQTRIVFTAALALNTPEERARYLDEVCRDKPILRQRVEALLRAHAQADHFLRINEPEPAILAEGPGTVISHYKLLEQIGEGGFGVVFMAEQVEPIRRKVALKIVKPGMDTKKVIARFEAERQALALMDHPNIARVFDAGATETGRPYFVMELVQGVPLTQFCDANDLPPQERLRLFMTVCKAVQHAHQKSVIHRDLKPSNILVTLHDGKPVPKVIDFGTAKALQQPLTEKTLFTAYGRLIGTPQYMSPEQAELSGLDVDTRADIYSLGVLLYELLTGTTPFEAERLRAAAFDEMMRIIRQEEPPKPSTRISTLGERATEIAKHRQVDPNLLQRSLRGDLDWIVMKALEKNRRRRYETASDLAEELQRHLEHRPVSAGPPSAIYRLKKLARRRQAALITTGSIALVIAAAAIVSLWLSARTYEAERRAASKDAALESALGASGALPSDAQALQVITGVANVEQEAALSPDETMLAYVNYDTPDWDLWVLDLNTGERRNLTQSEKHNPGVFQQCPGVFVWSPDSKWLAYAWADDRTTMSLRVIAAERSLPAVSFAATNQTYSAEIDVSGSRPEILFTAAGMKGTYYVPEAWTQDGRELLCRRHRPDGMALVNLDTSAVHPLPVNEHLDHPRLSPDDRYVVFSRSNEVHLLEILTGRQTQLTFGGGDKPIWAPNDSVVLFSGGWGLDGVRIEDGRPASEPSPVRYGIGSCDKRLTQSGRLIVHRELAPGDGYTIAEGAPAARMSVLEPFSGRIYLSVGRNRWLYTLTSEAGQAVVRPVGVQGQPSKALHAGRRWFLQLRAVSGTETRSNRLRNELWAVTADERGIWLAGDEQLDLQPECRWARDYERRLDDGRVSWVALSDSGAPPGGIYSAQVVFDDAGQVAGLVELPTAPLVSAAGGFISVGEGNHDWSPDGSQVVYAVRLGQIGQMSELQILDLRTRQIRKLTQGIAPVWSPDGSCIAFRRGHDKILTIHPDGSGLQTVAQRLHPGVMYAEPIPGYYELVWALDSSALLYGLHELNLDNKDFYRIARTGGEPQNFTRGVLGDAIPVAWLPKGEQ